MAKKDGLLALLKPAIEAMGYVCWGVQFGCGRRRALVRVFIDSSDGITLADCERVTKSLSLLCEVEDPIDMPYTLEVSSPGVNRALMEPAHYRLYSGHEISIRCYAPTLAGRRNFVGILDAVEESAVCLKMGEERLTIPFNTIKHANLRAAVKNSSEVGVE